VPGSFNLDCKTYAPAAFIISIAAAFSLTAAPETLRAQTELDGLTELHAVYVADPSAAWFEEWVETRLKTKEWLNRPDIRIAGTAGLVAAVEADASAIGVMTRGQLDRIHTDDAAAAIKIRETGLSVCAALAVSNERIEESFADFALSAGPIDVYATSDTLSIARALVDAHRFTDRMTIREVKLSAAMTSLAGQDSAVAVLPVLPQSPLSFGDQPGTLATVEMSAAVAQVLGRHGYETGSYRTSILQRIPFIEGERTVCDDIVQISASENTTIMPDSFTTSSTDWSIPFAGGDLEMRMRDAIVTLKALWHNSVDIKG
jgi:hypothetical protein